MKTTMKWAGAALAASLLGGAQPSYASSHREAPLISQDPAADATDFYMFRSPATDSGATNTVTLVANYWPLQEPGGGPNWAKFADNVLYEINIDNNGDAVPDIVYQFRFTTKYTMGTSSFLLAGGQVTSSPTDPNLFVTQSYTLTQVTKSGTTVLAQNVPVPPPNTGDFTFGGSLSGTSLTSNYTTVAGNAITAVTFSSPAGTGKVFAGQRDDPFFADLGAIFDLVRIRCNNTTVALSADVPAGCGTSNTAGVDFVGGYNVLSIVLQVPIANLTSTGTVPTTASASSIIGGWTTASRPRVTIRRAPSATAALAGVNVADSYGQWVQVSRLGLPLINEVIVPVGLKDYYNTTQPSNDAGLFTSSTGGPLLTNPELATRIHQLYSSISVPAAGRTDILALTQFQVGPTASPVGPFKGASYNLTNADILRLDVSTPAPANLTVNPRGALGVAGIGTQVAGGDTSFGFPNGRRLQDDVIDILEEVVGGGVLVTGFNVSPNNALGDGVNQNDAGFLTTFPYVAPPWSGSEVGGALGPPNVNISAGTNSRLHQVGGP